MTKTGMFASFIDFKKAYDRVDRGKLQRCLEGMGLGGRLSAFVKTVNEDVSCEVKVEERRSEPFKVTCGLRQGCILSPLLFSLYINSLIAKLRGRSGGDVQGSVNLSVIVCR